MQARCWSSPASISRFRASPCCRDVQLRLYPGEIHALMGQNGAGKSTLIKVLTGVLASSRGEMRLAGEPIRPASPLEAQKLGISTVYQEVNLCPNLSVAENIFAGRYPRRGIAAGISHRLGRGESAARANCWRASASTSMSRACCRATRWRCSSWWRSRERSALSSKVLILDEPTSSLDDDEVNKLFEVLRRLRGEGLAIVFVTHFLNQVYAVSDRITVLRNGSWVGEWRASRTRPAGADRGDAGARTGGAVGAGQRRCQLSLAMRLRRCWRPKALGQAGQLQPMDLQVRAGEVVGLAGLLGAGRTELARLLFGLEPPDHGVLTHRRPGRQLRKPGRCDPQRPRAVSRRAQDRRHRRRTFGAREHRAGAAGSPGLAQLSLARRADCTGRALCRGAGHQDREHRDADRRCFQAATSKRPCIARWLATEPRLLILDEPTRGIDVAAKQEIMERDPAPRAKAAWR